MCVPTCVPGQEPRAVVAAGVLGDAAHHLTLRQGKLEDEQETSLILFRPLEVAHAVMTCADYRS